MAEKDGENEGGMKAEKNNKIKKRQKSVQRKGSWSGNEGETEDRRIQDAEVNVRGG